MIDAVAKRLPIRHYLSSALGNQFQRAVCGSSVPLARRAEVGQILGQALGAVWVGRTKGINEQEAVAVFRRIVRGLTGCAVWVQHTHSMDRGGHVSRAEQVSR